MMFARGRLLNRLISLSFLFIYSYLVANVTKNSCSSKYFGENLRFLTYWGRKGISKKLLRLHLRLLPHAGVRT